MILKSYIAIFIALVFSGKALVLDSRIFIAILAAEEITYVNPLCQKKEFKNHKSSSEDIFPEASNGFHITMTSFCNAPFKMDLFSWDLTPVPEKFPVYAFPSPSLPENNPLRIYRPPQV